MQCCGKELQFEKRGISVSQAHCDSCGVYYQKRSGSTEVYKTADGGEGWSCAACGTEVQGTEVAHPIHDGPFALSGSGRVQNEVVPYCPKCETKPSFHGEFITVGE